jgi:hypothetical protein
MHSYRKEVPVRNPGTERSSSTVYRHILSTRCNPDVFLYKRSVGTKSNNRKKFQYGIPAHFEHPLKPRCIFIEKKCRYEIQEQKEVPVQYTGILGTS